MTYFIFRIVKKIGPGSLRINFYLFSLPSLMFSVELLVCYQAHSSSTYIAI